MSYYKEPLDTEVKEKIGKNDTTVLCIELPRYRYKIYDTPC